MSETFMNLIIESKHNLKEIFTKFVSSHKNLLNEIDFQKIFIEFGNYFNEVNETLSQLPSIPDSEYVHRIEMLLNCWSSLNKTFQLIFVEAFPKLQGFDAAYQIELKKLSFQKLFEHLMTILENYTLILVLNFKWPTAFIIPNCFDRFSTELALAINSIKFNTELRRRLEYLRGILKCPWKLDEIDEILGAGKLAEKYPESEIITETDVNSEKTGDPAKSKSSKKLSKKEKDFQDFRITKFIMNEGLRIQLLRIKILFEMEFSDKILMNYLRRILKLLKLYFGEDVMQNLLFCDKYLRDFQDFYYFLLYKMGNIEKLNKQLELFENVKLLWLLIERNRTKLLKESTLKECDGSSKSKSKSGNTKTYIEFINFLTEFTVLRLILIKNENFCEMDEELTAPDHQIDDSAILGDGEHSKSTKNLVLKAKNEKQLTFEDIEKFKYENQILNFDDIRIDYIFRKLFKNFVSCHDNEDGESFLEKFAKIYDLANERSMLIALDVIRQFNKPEWHLFCWQRLLQTISTNLNKLMKMKFELNIDNIDSVLKYEKSLFYDYKILEVFLSNTKHIDAQLIRETKLTQYSLYPSVELYMIISEEAKVLLKSKHGNILKIVDSVKSEELAIKDVVNIKEEPSAVVETTITVKKEPIFEQEQEQVSNDVAGAVDEVKSVLETVAVPEESNKTSNPVDETSEILTTPGYNIKEILSEFANFIVPEEYILQKHHKENPDYPLHHQLPTEIMDDLLNIIFSPRIKILRWSQTFYEFHRNFRAIMSEENSKARIIQRSLADANDRLKFVKVDPRDYQHLPFQLAFPGVEAGYDCSGDSSGNEEDRDVARGYLEEDFDDNFGDQNDDDEDYGTSRKRKRRAKLFGRGNDAKENKTGVKKRRGRRKAIPTNEDAIENSIISSNRVLRSRNHLKSKQAEETKSTELLEDEIKVECSKSDEEPLISLNKLEENLDLDLDSTRNTALVKLDNDLDAINISECKNEDASKTNKSPVSQFLIDQDSTEVKAKIKQEIDTDTENSTDVLNIKNGEIQNVKIEFVEFTEKAETSFDKPNHINGVAHEGEEAAEDLLETEFLDNILFNLPSINDDFENADSLSVNRNVRPNLIAEENEAKLNEEESKFAVTQLNDLNISGENDSDSNQFTVKQPQKTYSRKPGKPEKDEFIILQNGLCPESPESSLEKSTTLSKENELSGEENSREDELRTGNELPTKENQLPSKENELPSKENQLPSKENELPSKENELPSKENELSSKENELPSKENELPSISENPLSVESLQKSQDSNDTPGNSIENSSEANLVSSSSSNIIEDSSIGVPPLDDNKPLTEIVAVGDELCRKQFLSVRKRKLPPVLANNYDLSYKRKKIDKVKFNLCRNRQKFSGSPKKSTSNSENLNSEINSNNETAIPKEIQVCLQRLSVEQILQNNYRIMHGELEISKPVIELRNIRKQLNKTDDYDVFYFGELKVNAFVNCSNYDESDDDEPLVNFVKNKLMATSLLSENNCAENKIADDAENKKNWKPIDLKSAAKLKLPIQKRVFKRIFRNSIRRSISRNPVKKFKRGPKSSKKPKPSNFENSESKKIKISGQNQRRKKLTKVSRSPSPADSIKSLEHEDLISQTKLPSAVELILLNRKLEIKLDSFEMSRKEQKKQIRNQINSKLGRNQYECETSQIYNFTTDPIGNFESLSTNGSIELEEPLIFEEPLNEEEISID